MITMRQGIVVAATLGMVLFTAASAHAETISFEDMRRGTKATVEECSLHPLAVWVSAYGRGICMRYYLSSAGGTGSEATIFLNGDKPGTMPRAKLNPEDAKDTDTNDLERRAKSISMQVKQPAIYLARMGLDGSSGHHAQRRTKLELHITNAAISAIMRRHGFTTVNVFGQSGGSSLIGAMLSMRNDINCAISGSGRLVAKARAIARNRFQPDPALRVMNPADGISGIAKNSLARIIVLTDPDDKAVTREHQDPFGDALQNKGHRIEQFYVSARDEKHHGVTKLALATTRECIRGKMHDEIAEILARMQAQQQKLPRQPDATAAAAQPREAR